MRPPGWPSASTESSVVPSSRRDFATADLPALSAADQFVMVGHLAARDRWREVSTTAGPVIGLLPPLMFDGEALPMGPVPGLGEHTDAVLAELGIDPATVTS
jgi:crotonobetainyl-CoA:carnitine CoA-transferase CaiB-like acyl-CoA transferase